MLKYIVVGLIAAVPSTGSAATFWYLGGEPTVVTPGYEGFGRNQGYMIVEGERAGRVAYGDYPRHALPEVSGPLLTFDLQVGGWSDYTTYSVEFDHRGAPASWSFTSCGFNCFDPSYATSDRGDAIFEYRWDGSNVVEDFSWRASAGTWFGSEAAYVAAAKSAGVAPIPLPAAAWMLLAGIGGLAFAAKRRAS